MSRILLSGLPGSYLGEFHASDHAFPRSHEDVHGSGKEEVEIRGRQTLLSE